MSMTQSSSDYQNPEAMAIIQANRNLLLQTMQSLNISEIIIEYESYADSGDVTLLEVLPATQFGQLDTGLLIPYQFFIVTRDAQGHYLSAGQVKQVSLRVALCDFALSCLISFVFYSALLPFGTGLFLCRLFSGTGLFLCRLFS
jgi:hypothetical protein